MADEEYLTVAEVAEVLKLNPQTVRNWIDAGTMPALRIGRRVRIKRSDFQQILEDGYSGQSKREQPPPGSPTAEDFWNGDLVTTPEPAERAAERETDDR